MQIILVSTAKIVVEVVQLHPIIVLKLNLLLFCSDESVVQRSLVYQLQEVSGRDPTKLVCITKLVGLGGRELYRVYHVLSVNTSIQHW